MWKRRIFHIKRRMVTQSLLLFLLSSVLMIFIATLLFVSLDILFIWFSIMIVLAVFFIASLILNIYKTQKTLSTLLSDIETFVFGKRMLILDSILEFEDRGADVRQAIPHQKHQALVSQYEANTRKRFVLMLGVILTFCLIFSIGTIFSVPQGALKWQQILGFLEYRAVSPVPNFYIQSQTLSLDLTADFQDLGNLEVEVSGKLLQSDNGIYTLDESLTSLAELTITVHATRYGLQRTILTKRLYAAKNLQPDTLHVKVDYPSQSGLPDEEYLTLSDIEVWQGARITLYGTLNKALSTATLSDFDSLPVWLSNTAFSLSWTPVSTRQYRLDVVSKDGDSWKSSLFTIKVNPNHKPTVSLVFPTEDVMLSYSAWRVLSIVEAEDDIGLSSLRAQIVISNRNPQFSRFNQTRTSEISYSGERFVKRIFRFTYEDFEMLPGDVATVRFQAVDTFGLVSDSVLFNIVFPDLDEVVRERDKLQKTMETELSNVLRKYDDLQKDIDNKNVSGFEQKVKDIEKSTEKMATAAAAYQELSAEDEQANQFSEMQQTLAEMKKLTESLKNDSQTLREISKILQDKNANIDRLRLDDKLSMRQKLEKINSLLQNLEYYKKFANLLTEFNILQKTYETLKNQTDKEGFDKSHKAYQKELDKMKEMGEEKIRSISEGLKRESEALKPQNPESFQKSDQLMSQLSEEIKNELQKASAQRMQEKIDLSMLLIEEFYLNLILMAQSKTLEMGNQSQPILSNVNKLVENVNSISVSLSESKRLLAVLFEGMMMPSGDTDIKKELNSLFDDSFKILEITQSSLRDYNLSTVQSGLSYLGNNVALMALYLIKIQSALQNSMQNGQQQQGLGEMSMSMPELQQMQGSISQSLSEMLQKLAEEGKLTEEMREMMNEMAKLQSEIQKNLEDIMNKQDGGTIAGGNDMNRDMEDIIKDLQSYNVNPDTLKKSRNLEEKMLNSQKSIQSKGLNPERKAESAKVYEVKPPDALKEERREKIDLDSLKNRGLSEYYKKLIERYQSAIKN